MVSGHERQSGPRGGPKTSAPRSGLRRVWARVAWPALAIIAIAIVALTLVARLSPPNRHTLVVASMPYWNIQHDTAVVLAHRRDVNEVSPWIYGLSASGSIVPQYASSQAGPVASDLSRLRAAGLRIVPSIANVTGGNFAYQPVARMLHSPALERQQIDAIVSLVLRQKYAGIDIDYEQLHAADRQAFTGFITELAAALHAHHKVLSVAVFPQTSHPPANSSAAAQDYAALGKVADQVRIMGYNYHWAGSAPGATAPIGWVRSVLRYATSQLPASKVVLGIPLFGYTWPDGAGHGQPVSWLQAFRLSRQYHAPAHYSASNQAPYFSYSAAGHLHTVWFENAESSTAQFAAAKGAVTAGVYLWMYGYEDPRTWPALHSTLPLSGPGASTTSKQVP